MAGPAAGQTKKHLHFRPNSGYMCGSSEHLNVEAGAPGVGICLSVVWRPVMVSAGWNSGRKRVLTGW